MNINNIKFVIIFMLVILNYSCSSKTNSQIIGSWIYTSVVKNNIVECPDVLIFRPNSTYSILNDCAGFDSKQPIVEIGSWTYNISQEIILLHNRQHISEYTYQNKNKHLKLIIKKITDEEMFVCFDSDSCDKTKVEHYKKISQFSF